MRTTYSDATVRLYFLDSDAGAAQTLLYGTLTEAMALAEQQPEEVQAGLFLATDNDVVAYLDLLES
ncbi:MAG: hypothetical protein KDE15_10720 [Erythrobacter sp.]|nr:hypothetical protein [Erythrobacter sp.]